MFTFRLVVARGLGRFQFTACEPTIYVVVVCLFSRSRGLGGNEIFAD
jgi:hypothetical protein